MEPCRKWVIGKNKIEEFYFSGRFVVYVDNRRYDGAYEDAVREVFEALNEEGYINHG